MFRSFLSRTQPIHPWRRGAAAGAALLFAVQPADASAASEAGVAGFAPCSGPGATIEPADAVEPALAGLLPYRFPIARVEGSAQEAAAVEGAPLYEMIDALGGLEGQTLRLSAGVTPPAPPRLDRTTSGSAMLCHVAARAAALLPGAADPSIDQRLELVTVMFNAGSYELDSVVYGMWEKFPGHETIGRDEVGLGAEPMNLTFHNLSQVRRATFDLSDVELRFAEGGGVFRYTPGTIELDLLGVRRMISAGLLVHRGGFASLNECLRRDASYDPPFCANLRTRIDATGELPDPASITDNAEPEYILMGSEPVSALFHYWRERYGLDVAEAYLDEVWNYVAANADAARLGPAACAGGTADIAVSARAVIECTAEANTAYRRTSLEFVQGDAEPHIRQLVFAIAHELSHHVLGHERRLAETGAQRSACAVRLGLEMEADVVGGLLYNQVYADEPQVGLRREDAVDGPSFDFFGAWSPFFDGYVGFYQSRDRRCGYITGPSRHILFDALILTTLYETPTTPPYP